MPEAVLRVAIFLVIDALAQQRRLPDPDREGKAHIAWRKSPGTTAAAAARSSGSKLSSSILRTEPGIAVRS